MEERVERIPADILYQQLFGQKSKFRRYFDAHLYSEIYAVNPEYAIKWCDTQLTKRRQEMADLSHTLAAKRVQLQYLQEELRDERIKVYELWVIVVLLILCGSIILMLR